MLGKRKRETAVVSRLAEEEQGDPLAVPPDSLDVLRRYFEARFEPLEEPQRAPSNAKSDSEGSDSEWSGIQDASDDDDEALEVTPEVVDHSASHESSKEGDERTLRKKFMTARPPALSQPKSQSRAAAAAAAGAAAAPAIDEGEMISDAMNVKNDMALQRLLSESHLLESASDLDPTGKTRHRAIDLRLQAAGANDSIFSQKKMPMAHRKGMTAKAAKKEQTRRAEARENGIVLEKPTAAAKRTAAGRSNNNHHHNAKRDRGIGGPALGKFAGGTLRLSKRDVLEIQGSGRRVVAKGKKHKRHGRRAV
ncbi:pre-rRNA processing and 40S ribosomal subunit assembly [Ophidiomyces ophidiicola]|nr:pre-rRNA processing and 40S ribosomal subunit assembly [Ophidiomyces ophidiicola]